MRSTDEAREQIRRRLDAITRVAPAGDEDAEEPDQQAGRRPDWLEPGPPPSRPRARFAPGRRGVAALVLVGVVAAVVGVVGAWRDRPVAHAVAPLPAVEADGAPVSESAPQPAPTPPADPVAPPALDMVVSVVGLVRTAGLVHLPTGARIADALAAAGGAREGADLLGLNLAQKLADGDQVLVGLAPPEGAAVTVGSATVGAGSSTAGTSAAPAAGGKVNLNTATAEQLDALPGVGPVTAAAILAWRQTNGRFTDVEQLGEVDGIGPGRLQKLRDLVTV
ncbi:ComEA family DNA-binding protein [Rhodococcus spelaei]|uniref:ComEA family DNA-binding protein n=1 Tax=Rhodococcus spelaei TaxID=2546320 RepID=A0A541BM69_9NOCA|nr:ComEA family DNA-binding protein [Rhodococcus spelaei]TQF73432.1 ComEA family DNA-binding protein [Rhodococcus spelaei]